MKEVFGDEIVYIDSGSPASGEVQTKQRKMQFNFQGINEKYQKVQPVTMVHGRYLNENDILAQRKNVVIEAGSAEKLFGTENAVGSTFRTAINGSMEEYTVVGVYKKEMNAFQALLMGRNQDMGSAFIPENVLVRPGDTFSYCRLFGAEGIDMEKFMSRILAYTAIKQGNHRINSHTHQIGRDYEALRGNPRRLYCRLTLFSQSLQTILRIILDSTFSTVIFCASSSRKVNS